MDDDTAEQTTTEQPATEAPQADPDPFEAERQLDHELKESMSGPDELLGLEPEPAAPEPEDDGEAPPGDDDQQADAGEEPPPEPESTDGEQWTYARFRRAKREIGQEREQLALLQHQLQQQQAQLQPQMQAAQQLQQLAATDPAAAFQEFARLTGKPPRELYEGVVQSYLRDGTPEERDRAVSPELRAVQERLEAFERNQKESQQAAQQQALEQQRQQEASMVYSVAVNGADDGKGNVTEYPYLAALLPEQLEAAVRSAVDMAAQLRSEKGIVRTVGQVCSVLDQQAQKAYEYQHSRLQKRLEASSGPDASGANGESQESSTDEGNPAGAAKGRRSERKPRQPRAPGNRAGAGTSPGARPKTRDEIDDELDRSLREGLRQYVDEMTSGG